MTDKPLRVPDDDLDFDDNQMFFWQGKLFTGTAYEERDGRLIAESEYKDGYQDGTTREWYSSGVLKSEKSYRYSTSHGLFSEYDEDGHLTSRKMLEHGIVVWSESFAPGGTLLEREDIDRTGFWFKLLEKRRRESRWD